MAGVNALEPRIAFRGNVRRAMRKTIAGGKSLLGWISAHQNNPVQPLTVAQYNQLLGLIGALNEQLQRTTFLA